MRYPIYWTDKLPPGVGGRCLGPLVQIRPKYEGDEGIRQHELSHCKHWWMLTGAGAVLAFAGGFSLTLGACVGAALGPLLYLAIRPIRRWEETHAYKIQMQYPRMDGTLLSADSAAEWLAQPLYDLGITVEQAKQALQ